MRTLILALSLCFGSFCMLALAPQLQAASNYQENFDSGQAQGWTTFNGDWNVVSQYYANTVTSGGKTLAFFQNDTWTTGFTYGADVYLHWYNTGNNGGVIFGYQDDGNFYEVLFNVRGTGEANGSVTINRVSAGTVTAVATGTITNLLADTWFRTQVSLNGSDVTVWVDDAAVASVVLPVAPIAGQTLGISGERLTVVRERSCRRHESCAAAAQRATKPAKSAARLLTQRMATG